MPPDDLATLLTAVLSAPVGAIIVGPLIIGAGILALIGIGAVWASRGRRPQLGPGASGHQPGGGAPSAQKQDPLDTMEFEELRRQAGSMLVSADDAVNASAQEILFAEAAYGSDQVRVFQEDIDASREHLRESFRLQQQVDQSPSETEQETRELLKRIIGNCRRIDETLESHRQEFEGLRSLERDPGPALEQLSARLDALSPRREEAAGALGRLEETYDDGALRQYRDNLAQAAEALQTVRSACEQARGSHEAGESAEAVVAVHRGEQAAADAEKLIESMEETEERLQTARRNLDVGLDQTEQDIAQAKATHEAGQAPELAGPIAAAEAAVRRVSRAVESQERIDPLELLQGLELAHRELDEPLNAVRDRQAKDRRAREMLQAELLTARNQVQASADFLRSRRHGVGSTARTRMAEAERCLSEAQTFSETQPSRALDMAVQAKTLAVQAAQIAEREVAESALMGGAGMGTAWGGAGYGGGGFGGYGAGGFGMPRPRVRYGTFGPRPRVRGLGYGRRRRGLF